MNVTPPALIQQLSEAGFDVSDVWDLVNSKKTYRAAIPVLLDWLRNLDDRAIGYDKSKLWEGLIRSLSVPGARPVAGPLMVEEFRTVVDPTGLGPRWVVGNALSIVADDSLFDSLESLVLDRSYGKARQMIVLGLGKSKRPEAADLLISLVDDPDVDGHAVKALGKLKVERARGALESKSDDPRSWVRSEARKALAKLPS